MKPIIIRVMDTETTSFEGGCVEVASVDIIDGKICNPMSDFVKPPEAISFEAMAIHHITEDMVANAPLIDDVIDKYKGADLYVAHNAVFDREKLPQIDGPWLCTLKLARKAWPEEKHSNQYLRYWLGLNVEVPEGLHAHRALYDCYVTAAILIHIGKVSKWSVREMRDISARPSLLHKMTFGKHRGKTFTEIQAEDPNYFRWCLSNMEDLSEDLEFTMKTAMGAMFT